MSNEKEVGVPLPVLDDIPYDSGAMAQRLAIHDTTHEAFQRGWAEVGSLHPDHGGDWPRSRKACRFLLNFEGPAKAKYVADTERRWNLLEPLHKSVVRGYVGTTGVARDFRHPMLTVGERIVWDYWIDHAPDPEFLERLGDAFGFDPEAESTSTGIDGAGEDAADDAKTPRPTIVHTRSFAEGGSKITWLVCDVCGMDMASTVGVRKCPSTLPGTESEDGKRQPCPGKMMPDPDQSNIHHLTAEGIDLLFEAPTVGVPTKKAEVLRWVADPHRAAQALAAQAQLDKPAKGLVRDLLTMMGRVPDEYIITERREYD